MDGGPRPRERVLATARGRDGVLTVRDLDDARGLWVGDRCHGASWLAPAATIGDELLAPGPVPESPYQLGWLAPAAMHPVGDALMVGLGCGAGAVALLANAPALRLTVVEIDPVVVALARAWFPLVARLETAGRLRVVLGDADDFPATERAWAFACLDAYAADARLVVPRRLLAGLRGNAGALWTNVVTGDDVDVGPAMAALADAGWPTRSALPVADPDDDAFDTRNVLLASEPLDHAALAALEPFADLAHPRARAAARCLRVMARRAA